MVFSLNMVIFWSSRGYDFIWILDGHNTAHNMTLFPIISSCLAYNSMSSQRHIFGKTSYYRWASSWLRWYRVCLQCRRPRFDPCIGKIHREGNGYPLQCSCLKNLMDRRAWWVTVYGVTKSQTGLSIYHFHFHIIEIKWIKLRCMLVTWIVPETGNFCVCDS